MPNAQVVLCYEKPKRSIKGDLRLPVADPGTPSVSHLAGDGGSDTGEGGFSSSLRGWLSASASSTCTSGCSSVAGTGERKEAQHQREARSQGLAVFYREATESVCGGASGSLASQQGPQERSMQGAQ